MNGKIVKVIGVAATVLGLMASVVTDWVNERKMTEMIDEKVNEALANKAKEEKEENEDEKEES